MMTLHRCGRASDGSGDGGGMTPDSIDRTTVPCIECRVCGAEVVDTGTTAMPDGWGFIWMPEPAEPRKMGWSYACPEHKDDEE